MALHTTIAVTDAASPRESSSVSNRAGSLLGDENMIAQRARIPFESGHRSRGNRARLGAKLKPHARRSPAQ